MIPSALVSKMDQCKESQLNRKIIHLMDEHIDDKNKKRKHETADLANVANVADPIDSTRQQIKRNVITHICNLEQNYKSEADSVLHILRSELDDKSKQLDTYYKYCQRYKEEYAAAFSRTLEDSKTYQQQVEALKAEYLQKQVSIESKRERELDRAFVQFKESLMKTSKDLENKTFVDKNMKELVVDILGLMDV